MTKTALEQALYEIKDRIIYIEGNNFSKSSTAFIAIGGLHGNEKSGPKALQNVQYWMQRNLIGLPNSICCIGVKGNVKALSQSTRFICRDLNRMWTKATLNEFLANDFDLHCHEFSELSELLYLLDFFFKHFEKVVVLDMHTTSAKGGKFFISNGDEYSEALSQQLNIPLITNLKGVIKGPMINYVEQKGATGIVVEAGQHIEPEAVDVLEDVLKNLTLFLGNNTTFENVKNVHGTSKVRFKYRHPVAQTDVFKMRPGYANFQKVTEGMVLADDKNGEIKAPCSGILLMPLYQKKGEDGFFIAEPIV